MPAIAAFVTPCVSNFPQASSANFCWAFLELVVMASRTASMSASGGLGAGSTLRQPGLEDDACHRCLRYPLCVSNFPQAISELSDNA